MFERAAKDWMGQDIFLDESAMLIYASKTDRLEEHL
jgi:hypothetical protein